jgi:iron complex outermembrane receptor protein
VQSNFLTKIYCVRIIKKEELNFTVIQVEIHFMKKLFIPSCLIFLLYSLPVVAQNEPDSIVGLLETITIKAYEGSRKMKEVPASVNYISGTQLNRYDNSNILTAVNITPGARMEERSPGSYRLNMRGSSIRSPFGVRNVKVYWNDIPFTDPGGNTYLNQLSIFNFQNIEIIKGPSGSLYGAGNGGALLINHNPLITRSGLDINYTAGSFGMFGLNVQFNGGTDKLANSINVGRLNKDGYREHTNMRRDIATWQLQLKTSSKNKLILNVLFGDLYYQTPGGLTRSEYFANPKMARPAAGTNPSAEIAKAAIYQKMYIASVADHFQITEHLSNHTVVYSAKVELKNPTFRNYEARSEPHIGGRTVFKWQIPSQQTKAIIVWGAEMQRGNFNILTHTNKAGTADKLLTDDDVKNRNLLLFAQADFSLPHNINITAGASMSRFKVGITRKNVANPVEQSRTYENEIAPRIAVSKKLIKDLWLYASVAKGFSPPTTAEVLPSNSVISTSLNAEHGISYEGGIKSNWWKDKIYFEACYFNYQLKDAIVQRRDASNADFFVNAGSTKQKGVEWQILYNIINNEKQQLNHLSFRLSHALYVFRYQDFKQVTNEYSGNRLPGVPKNTVGGLLDVSLKSGPYLNMTYFYGDRVALNDANTDFASSYNLLGARLGWRIQNKGRTNADFFMGGENLFDMRYSLGNDINAAGGRYFNTAPGLNIYAGVALQFK